MKIIKFNSVNELSNFASDLIINLINKNPGLLFCAASGNSPTETYRQLAEKKHRFHTENLRILKLDEWGGISSDNSESCETYLLNNVITPLQIKADNYTSFQSNPKNPENEVQRIQNYLNNNGPIDICVLGLGLNGHIAFNEPADKLHPHCHLDKLTDSSQTHSMAKNMGEKSTYGLTLGMADILQSKKIILLVLGKNKTEIVNKFLKQEITTYLPASFLWLHHDVDCLILNEED